MCLNMLEGERESPIHRLQHSTCASVYQSVFSKSLVVYRKQKKSIEKLCFCVYEIKQLICWLIIFVNGQIFKNIACILQAMSFLPVSSSVYPSCTKTVTIHLNEHNIKLKQGHEVLVNGQEVSKLPITAAGAYIHSVSSIFLRGKLTL